MDNCVFSFRRISRQAAAVLALATLTAGARASAASSTALTFEKDIRPILKTNCFQCHGEDKELKGKLDVRLRRFLMTGGKSGPAIVPGHPQDSALYDLVSKGDMPKGKRKLSDRDIDTIQRWIAQGALTARPEPEKVTPELAFTEEERNWWAFQPIKHPAVPQSKSDNPIDAFLSAKLAEKGLAFSSPADRVTLIRRATFDLIGLPPTPEEIDAFVNDKSPDAYDHLVDRLLASPLYGERWGRHWLDVAGYADSDGFNEVDTVRAWSWRYRDYVIQALNKDKPFDQFVREQLAGDEMVPQPHRNLSPDAIEKITATGYLRMAADGTAGSTDLAVRNAVMADTMKIISGSLYGMTIGCAQCHDHRYDPITQADYYRLRAVFEPAFDWNHWKVPNSRLVSLLTDTQRAESTKIEEEAKKIDDARLKKQEEYITQVLDKELAVLNESIREPLRAAFRVVAAKRTPEQKKLLRDNPTVEKLNSGSLYLYDRRYGTKLADDLKKMAADAAEVRAKKPKEEFVQALDEAPATSVPVTHIFNRGQPTQPTEEVHPSDLTVLASLRKVDIADKSKTMPTSGRRLAFAQELTDGRHPLLARVLVNRIWTHHFGKGIVTSVGDFGKLGQEPSHPELLDWLASDFMKEGWSMKKLHRLIVTSEAYRQCSTRDGTKERIDPDNALLSRMNVVRLEAEAMRDSMLFVSGKMLEKSGGPPVPVMLNEEGQVVLGVDTTDTAGRQTGKYIPLNGEDLRRSIYIQIRRTRPLNMLETFDAPAMTDCNCMERPSTTVSPQSLLLMNNGYMREYAEHFAERLQKEAAGDLNAQVDRAFRLCYGRHPSAAEAERSLQFVSAQTTWYKEHPSTLEYATAPTPKNNADPALLGLTALCHALMSANEFLYVD